MDFIERLREMGTAKCQALGQAISGMGEPKEILAYIAAMPVCCEEGQGLLHITDEVRLDSRFLVVCHRTNVTVYPMKQVQTFCVSACESGTRWRFCINNRLDFFCVNPGDAQRLYTQLAALCPGFFRPVADTSPMKLYENVSLVFGNGEITVQKLTLFGKVKMVKTIPLRGLRSCYQTVDSDPESPFCYLYLCMADGTEHRVDTFDDRTSFQVAQRLKALVPGLVYTFPQLK